MLSRKVEWANLKKLYEFESSRVSGPGSYRRDINSVLWTLDELKSSLSLSTEDAKDFERMVLRLLRKRQIMKIPMPNGQDRYITRTAEIVRLLGHNYEYWPRGRQSIDSVRWLIEDKKIPTREIPVEIFVENLLEMVRSEISNDDTTLNLRTAIKMVLKGIARYLEPTDWTKTRFSIFQLQAAREMILSQFKQEYGVKTQILTAGVGSGKTIAFSIGMLVSAVEGILSGEKHRRCHLFLYPRKALAHDQYTKLKDIAKNIELEQLNVHLEHYSFYSSENLSVKKGIPIIYAEPNPPPSIIITTLETLNRRLQHPLVISKLSKYLRRAVLDEIHLIEGIPGCHVVRLLDRLRQICDPRELLWTGSSATVARPDLHAATVFGVNPKSVKVVEPALEDLTTVGMKHHIFIRPTGRLSFLGTLINSTSVLIHNRRGKIWKRTGHKYPKTIGFADNLDLLGRWNSDLRENERTEQVRVRKHPSEPDPRAWSLRQRQVPYALRFHKPLERRINAMGGKGEPYEPVLAELRGKEICNRCRAGERISLKVLGKDEMYRLGRFVNRWPHKDKDKVTRFNVGNEDIFETDSMEIGTLDLCPYLRAGACFWFTQDDLESERLVGGSNPRYEWRSVARSKIHSSKTRPKVELDDDLSELVFTSTLNVVYDLWSDDDVPTDIVLASPSLEVGVDLPNVTESIMFKAIRNVASYRQKVGRIGREEESDTINISLVSLRPVDLHYYRQPRKLTSRAQLEPIPLKEYNDSILRCALYMAVWDYLALHSNLPEVIPLSGISEEETDFTKRLKISRKFLDENRRDIALHLSRISRGKYRPDNDALREVMDQVSEELGIFLTPTSGTIQDEQVSYVSDMIVRSLNTHGARVRPPKQSRNLRFLKWGEEQYREFRPFINPVLFGLSEQFQELDRLNDSGWVGLQRVKDIHESIENTLATAGDDATPMVKKGRDVLERISDRALADIIKGLQGMYETGEDPTVVHFFEQYDRFRREHQFWPYYMSYTIQGLPIFSLCRKDPSYTRPPNLFTNPYEERVILYLKGEVEDSVPISEVLFGFIPGTWTFRVGKVPRKTLVGKLDSYRGGILSASISEMRKQGNEFIKIKTDVPAPPGFPSEYLTLYMPTKLSLRNIYGKYVTLNVKRRTVIDGDEDSTRKTRDSIPIESDEEEESKDDYMQTKIPQSHLDTWVHISADAGKRILVNEIDEEYLVIEGDKKHQGIDARKRIYHPMLKGIIDTVLWHDRLEVYDYVYTLSRTYSSKAVTNATLMFRDDQNDVGFGRYFTTEGVSLELDPTVVKKTASIIKEEMLSYSSRWAPSLVKAFQASFSSMRLSDGTPISPYIIKDLFGVLITATSLDLDFKAIFELPKAMDDLLSDEGKFGEAAQEFYKGKYLIGHEEETFTHKLSQRDRQDIDRQVSKLAGLASQLKGSIPDIKDKLENWIIHTLLNTFGLSALSALQRLCGSKETDIGYCVDLKKIEDGRYRVFLYDRTPHGNGSSDVLRRYLHILNIQRHRQTDESRLLPSEDFLTLLEQELLQCPQFHSDMDALEKFSEKKNNQVPKGLPELGYVSEYSDEVLRVCERTWNQLGIGGRDDAWKLPIISMAPGSFAKMKGLEIDDVIRATAICWNGCPECVINPGATIGLAGETFVDKAVLDEWFKTGRKSVEEYKEVSVKDMATGKLNVKIGRQTLVCLALPNRKIRSISLPFTIGFELERRKALPHAQLIIRDNDIQGLRAFKERFDGCAHGLESLGFKRIMWFNLMTAAYLDVLGLLEKKRKEVAFVFYDCRDVTFDDVGISHRMMEAIEYHCKKAGMMKELSRLSDMLIWLAKRGFRISFCVDENRSREEDVRAFLEKLDAAGMSNISIRIKGLHGLMHKKALITPLGAIQGSANLTYSGTRLNEEIINYAPYGVREYDEMKLNILDTFHGSKKWEITQ